MKTKLFRCGNKRFKTVEDAIQYANKYHKRTGIFLGIYQ